MHKCVMLDPAYRIKEKTVKAVDSDSFPTCPNSTPISFHTEITANPLHMSAMRTSVETRIATAINKNVDIF